MKFLLKLYILLIILTAWFGLILQLYLSAMLVNEYSTAQNILHYFMYFTVLTNLLVALASTAALLRKPLKLMSFFTNFKVVSAVTLYILFVGIMYHIALSSTWNPQGLQLLADNLLHYVIPSMFFIYWIFIIRREKLLVKQGFIWLIYPFAYFLYATFLGRITTFYPYYFINVKHIGYLKLGTNFLWLLLAFLIMGLLLIGINRLANRAGKN